MAFQGRQAKPSDRTMVFQDRRKLPEVLGWDACELEEFLRWSYRTVVRVRRKSSTVLEDHRTRVEK